MGAGSIHYTSGQVEVRHVREFERTSKSKRRIKIRKRIKSRMKSRSRISSYRVS
jgi:hypothetical protein